MERAWLSCGAITYPAVEFRPGDPSSVDDTTITVKGTLHRKLFRNKSFTGEMEIAKYDVTKSRMFPVTFHNDIHNGWGSFTYMLGLRDANGAPITANLIGFGSIWMTEEFESVKLLLTEPVGKGEGQGKDLQILAPATDYVSALALSEQYKERGQY
ncbi:hypothetical protein M3194_25240 [Paenibacillus glycanilyticus]|uniref:hypothetical protein n=1 Tax=Paenibacillus glycanilyticus TaxID=126569 RepID=UPI00203A76BD|nr:hypothetical protein [Paenibacillus glycanilyticus]MCM3630641.1 hypothetical protein [Paenibacillus glycanilyticus]